ncbi:MAG: hypothetical protein AAF628_37265 [Planctomycetota bacterium]
MFVVGTELWMTDGSPAGTAVVRSFASQLGSLTRAGRRVIFSCDEGEGSEPWVSDGTPAGTLLLADTHPGPIGGFSGATVATGSRKAYFVADDGTTGGELWETDGTPAGTRLVQDLNPGPWSGLWYGQVIALAANRLLLAADNGTVGTELFAFDPGAMATPIGTPCGTATGGPTLYATDPVLGGVVDFELLGAPAGTGGVLLVGWRLPRPQLIGDCQVHVASAGTVPIASPFVPVAGAWTHSRGVPSNPALHGGLVTAQVALGPTTTAPLHVDLSNAVYFRFGAN